MRLHPKGELLKNPIEDWGATVAAGAVAATLPLLVGWTMRLFAPDIRLLGADIGPWVVLLVSPITVFLCARWAARATHGIALVRATMVGLLPGVLLIWVIVKRYPVSFHDWTAPFSPVAVLIWILLNLACGLLAGVLVWRRQANKS